MAEFSPNPDDRKKSETSYSDFIKKIKHNQSDDTSYRISINKYRVSRGMEAFLNKEEFEEIIEDSELSGENLTRYLLDYVPGLLTDQYVDHTFNKGVFKHNHEIVIDCRYLSELLNIKQIELNNDLIEVDKIIKNTYSNLIKQTPSNSSLFFIRQDILYVPYITLISLGIFAFSEDKERLNTIIKLIHEYENDFSVTFPTFFNKGIEKLRKQLLDLI